MIAVAIVRRRLRPGKTYDDFRRAWYHQTGFGASNRMLTALNVADPREVIVIALTEVSPDDAARLLEVDASERTASPLNDVIEPPVDRTFGILIAEDDFSSSGPVPYRPATVGGSQTDLGEVHKMLALGATMLAPHIHPPAGSADSQTAQARLPAGQSKPAPATVTAPIGCAPGHLRRPASRN